MKRDTVLRDVLRDIQRLSTLTPSACEELLHQARAANLLGRLAYLAERSQVQVPELLIQHFAGIRYLVAAHRQEVLREVRLVAQALAPVAVPIVLLKGAAYVLSDIPSGQGRLFADIDLLVPKSALPVVEQALLQAGWMGEHHDPYDQRYYREWMHEIPPLRHVRRGTVLDVHHAITPLTAAVHVPGQALMLQPLDDAVAGVSVLAPADMVLHSMVHLLWNEDLSHGLRDLSDLDLLLRHHAGASHFWDELMARAVTLGLQRTLYHAVQVLRAVLGTPFPDSVLRAIRAWRGPIWSDALLHACWRRTTSGLRPHQDPFWMPLALAVLFMRAHALRMPAGLLLRHMANKVWRALRGAKADAQA